MLSLHSLDMYNWCNLQGRKSIHFEEGFNVINGRNGRGKTSIVNAISILLLNRYEGNLEGFINDKSTEASTKLEFSINQDLYTSSLYLKKTKGVSTERLLVKNGIEIARGEDCEKELNKLLPSFLTSYSLFYKQGSENKITDCTDSERRELLTQLVALDYSDRIAAFILPTIEALNTQITDSEKELYALENKSYILGTEKEVPGEKHSQVEIDIATTQVELWKNNERNKQVKQKLATDIAIANTDLINTKQKYDEAQILKEEADTIAAIEADKTKQLNEIEAARTVAKTNSKSKVEAYLETIANCESGLRAIVYKEVPAFNDATVLDLSNDIAALKSNQASLEDACKDLQTGKCPVCGGNCEHKLQDYEQKLGAIRDQIEDLNKDLEIAKQLQLQKKQAEDYNLECSSKSKDLQSKLDLAKNQIEVEKQSIVALLRSYKDREDSINESTASRILELKNGNKERLATATEIVAQKQKYLDSLQEQFDNTTVIENLEDPSLKLQEMLSINKLIDEVLAYNEAIVQQNNLTLKQQEQDKAVIEELKERLVNLKKQLADNKLAVEVTSKTYPTWKLERDLKGIENSTNLFVEDIYKPLHVTFQANKNSLKMTYGEGERPLPVKRLSGAEKQIVNLATENIFNRQQALSCLILDESDSAMDNENKGTFFNTLLSLQEHYKQILVITHSKEVKDKLLVEGANIIMLG